MFVHITRGVGYWMQPGKNLELAGGSTLIFSHAVQGSVRASQLGPTVVHLFQVEPERLAGVVTLGEKEFLQAAAGKDGLNFRLLASTDPVSEKFAEICQRGNGGSLRGRLQLLESLSGHSTTGWATRELSLRLIWTPRAGSRPF